MINFKMSDKNEHECAVSPVVGVMLMLVVTIIVAAVVSGFSGGLLGGNNQKTPTLSMDVKIANTGRASDSGFSATVLSISDPTPTNKLKITTSWVTTMKDNTSYKTGIPYSTPNQKAFAGGNSTVGNASAPTPPFGFGPGITGIANMSSPYFPNQNFGNFTLTQGTGLVAEPLPGYGTDGADQYMYYSGVSTYSDIQAVLGPGWEQLRPGDVVTVRIVYTSTGKTMFQKDVTITGA